MQIGFQDVDEKEQKFNKSMRDFRMFYGKIVYLILWIGIFGGLIGSLYYGVRAAAYQEDTDRFTYCLTLFCVLLGVRVIVWLITFLTEKIQVNGESNVEGLTRKRLPNPSTVTLRSTLTYMSAKIGRVVWDILLGVCIVSFGLAYGSSEEMSFITLMLSLLKMVVVLLAGHFLFSLYYKVRSFRRKMLKITKRYLTIENENAFTGRLEKSLKEGLLYRSRQFIITKEFFLGYSNLEGLFEPAAIPFDQISQAEFYILKTNGKAMVDKGILACKLKNGSVVEFFTGQGKNNPVILKVLDYYGLDYQKNEWTMYKL